MPFAYTDFNLIKTKLGTNQRKHCTSFQMTVPASIKSFEIL